MVIADHIFKVPSKMQLKTIYFLFFAEDEKYVKVTDIIDVAKSSIPKINAFMIVGKTDKYMDLKDKNINKYQLYIDYKLPLKGSIKTPTDIKEFRIDPLVKNKLQSLQDKQNFFKMPFIDACLKYKIDINALLLNRINNLIKIKQNKLRYKLKIDGFISQSMIIIDSIQDVITHPKLKQIDYKMAPQLITSINKFLEEPKKPEQKKLDVPKESKNTTPNNIEIQLKKDVINYIKEIVQSFDGTPVTINLSIDNLNIKI